MQNAKFCHAIIPLKLQLHSQFLGTLALLLHKSIIWDCSNHLNWNFKRPEVRPYTADIGIVCDNMCSLPANTRSGWEMKFSGSVYSSQDVGCCCNFLSP